MLADAWQVEHEGVLDLLLYLQIHLVQGQLKPKAGGRLKKLATQFHNPNLPHDEVQKLADKAHEVCPYSKATRGNIEVKE